MTIYDRAFRDCTTLKNIIIPNSVKSIGDEAFKGCISLESIDIPNSVTNIGKQAFSYCTSLKRIDIPTSVKEIGEGAFSHCTSVESIDISEGVEKIGAKAFFHTGLQRIDIPSSIHSIGELALCDCPISIITVKKENPIYYSIDNVLYKRVDEGKNVLVKYAPNKTESSFTVGKDTAMLDSGAFMGAKNLEEIILQDNLSSLGDEQTFSKCVLLHEIRIPSKVNKIPKKAFYLCTHLLYVFLPNSENYTICESVFEECSLLFSVHSEVHNVDNIIIDKKAFEGFGINKCTLYVPSGARWNYQHHKGFNKFKRIEIE